MRHGSLGAPGVGVVRPAEVLALALVVLVSACRGDRPPAPPSPALLPPPPPSPPSGSRLPREYVLVGPAGATAFATPPSGQPGTATASSRVDPGFGFAVVGETHLGAGRFLRIADGRWLPAAQIIRARPSTFAGAPIPRGQAPQLAWVIAREAVVRTQPSATAPMVTTRPAHTRLPLRQPCAADWCPLTVGWISRADVTVPTLLDRPAHAGPLDRWLDIDLASQTLLAFEGDRPVYATLISSGVGAPGSPFATPTGLFAIQAKRELVRMDNLEHTGVVPYSYDVPLAQYFTDGKALHAALWHDRFGRPSSHGCVNLAPADAEWLYAFTSAPGPHPGTAVRIRGQLPPGPPRELSPDRAPPPGRRLSSQ